MWGGRHHTPAFHLLLQQRPPPLRAQQAATATQPHTKLPQRRRTTRTGVPEGPPPLASSQPRSGHAWASAGPRSACLHTKS